VFIDVIVDHILLLFCMHVYVNNNVQQVGRD